MLRRLSDDELGQPVVDQEQVGVGDDLLDPLVGNSLRIAGRRHVFEDDVLGPALLCSLRMA